MIDSFIKLGFSRTEAEVFLAILKHNPCHVIHIFKETGKHRQVIYNALDNLEQRGLIIVSKKHGKNLYSIGDSHRVLLAVKEKEVIAKDIVRQIEEKINPEQEQVEVFSGAESYVNAMDSFRLHAENAKEFIVFGGQKKKWFNFTQKLFDRHVAELKRMKQTGVDIFILYFKDEWESAKNTFSKYINNPYTVKVLQSPRALPHTVWIAGDHVYILTPVEDPLIVHIKSLALAKKYHTYFWDAWMKGKIITK